MTYTIDGKYNSAHVYASQLDDVTIGQITNLCNQEWLQDSHIAVMADAHAGKGCTVGTTITLHGKVSPNLVGVDIGCGMLVVNLGKTPIDLESLDKAITQNVPSGFSVHNQPQMKLEAVKQLRAYDFIKKPQHITQSLGTLGGGNHFIEVDRAGDGTHYLVIHSGSRNLGKQIADHYQDLAIQKLQSQRFDISHKRRELIEDYKSQGRQSDIPQALEALNYHRETLSREEKDMAYLSGDDFNDYIHDMKLTQAYAVDNREHMANIIIKHLNSEQGFNLEPLSKKSNADFFHTIHNYIDTDTMILRKGAISAQVGELVIIPINMRDGCILAHGKGEANANLSGPHGAGRQMSRRQAKENINLEHYQSQMEGIYTSSVNQSTLDEAPDAYKPIDVILEDIQDCVDVIEVIKPIYSFKSSN